MSLFHHPLRSLVHVVHDTQHGIESMLLLFVFGAVLLALAGPRMEKLELEIAARPARAFALGIVSFVLAIAAAAGLAVTVIGIPFVLAFAVVAVFATYAGIAAVLRTFGAALIRHRTDNVYVHLALGCALFLVASAVPWLGDFVTLAVAMLGLGAVVASRLAGFWPRQRSVSL